ncbi:MAG: NAD(P)/FAD-dependent oxidoreductase [Candidatus Methanomethylophilaceae archaeon]
MEVDVLIIGCGPAGLQAAIHASRRKCSVLVVGKERNSSIAGTHLDNYFGTGVTEGNTILEEGRRQAEATGAVFREENVISSAAVDGGFSFKLESGEEVVSRSVVIATGVSRTKLGIPGERELYGKGVSYCAICDCNFYRGRRVVIVGNESEAAVSAEMMTNYASETSWVAWDITANDSLVERAKAAGVTMYPFRPDRVEGDGKVERLVLKDGTVIPTDGVFIELGAKSAADIAMDLGVMPEMDDSIKVGRDCSTEVPGVYACGDVTGKPWQVAKAVGEGCIAGLSAAEHAGCGQ